MICEECKKKTITKCACGKRIRYGSFFCKKCLQARKEIQKAELGYLMNIHLFTEVANTKFKASGK